MEARENEGRAEWDRRDSSLTNEDSRITHMSMSKAKSARAAKEFGAGLEPRKTAPRARNNDKGNASPFFAGAGSRTPRVRPDDLAVDKQNAGQLPMRSTGVGHPLFDSIPTTNFHNSHNATLPSSGPSGTRRRRKPSSVDSLSDLFPDGQSQASGSRPTSTRGQQSSVQSARELLARQPLAPASARRGQPSAGFGSHGKQPRRSDDSGDEVEAIERPASDGDEDDYAKKVPKKKRNLSLGTKPRASAIGVTPGEVKAQQKAQELPKGRKKEAANKKSELGTSNLAKSYTAKVEHSFLSFEPVTDLHISTINWNDADGRCTLVNNGTLLHLRPSSAEAGAMACSDSKQPTLWLSFNTASEKQLARDLQDRYNVKFGQQSIDIRLYLEPGISSGQLIQSIITHAKSHAALKISTFDLNAARSSLEGLQSTVAIEVDRSQTTTRLRSAQAADARADKQQRKPMPLPTATKEFQTAIENLKRNPSKKGKEKEVSRDEAQSTLDYKPREKRKTRQSETIDVASSPEAPKPKKNPPRGAKQKTSPSYLDDSDEDGKPEPVVPAKPMPPKPDNWNGVLFPYPLNGRADINITEGDKWRVEAGDFLNDTLIEFGLKYVLAAIKEKTGDTHVDIDKDVHLFNSFFYEKLSSGAKPAAGNDQPWAAYNSVRKWTKSKKVFEKKYLIVPINENAHWYLAVIFQPAGILREYIKPADGVEDPTTTEAPSLAVSAAPSPAKIDESDLANVEKATEEAKVSVIDSSPKIPAKVAEVDISNQSDDLSGEGYEIMPEDKAGRVVTRSRKSEEGAVAFSASRRLDNTPTADLQVDVVIASSASNGDDPLDVISPSKPAVRRLNRRIKERPSHSQGEASQEAPAVDRRDRSSPARSSPIPISSLTLDAYNSQNQPTPAKADEAEKKEEAEGVIDGGSPIKKARGSKVGTKAVVKEKPPLNIYHGADTWIMTFDSLGGHHKPVDKVLRLWLEYEAKDKVANCPKEFTPSIYKEAIVPTQPNFSDCGLYLIHFVEQLLDRPEQVMRNIEMNIPPSGLQRKEFFNLMNVAWNNVATQKLRETWTRNIDDMANLYATIKASLAPEADSGKAEKVEGDGKEDVEPEIPLEKSQSSVAVLSQMPVPQPSPAPDDRIDVDVPDLEQPSTEGEPSEVPMPPGPGEDVEMADAEEDERKARPRLEKGKGREVDPDDLGLGAAYIRAVTQGDGLPSSQQGPAGTEMTDDPMVGIKSPSAPAAGRFTQSIKHIMAPTSADTLNPSIPRIPIPWRPPGDITVTAFFARSRDWDKTRESLSIDYNDIDPDLDNPSHETPDPAAAKSVDSHLGSDKGDDPLHGTPPFVGPRWATSTPKKPPTTLQAPSPSLPIVKSNQLDPQIVVEVDDEWFERQGAVSSLPPSDKAGPLATTSRELVPKAQQAKEEADAGDREAEGPKGQARKKGDGLRPKEAVAHSGSRQAGDEEAIVVDEEQDELEEGEESEEEEEVEESQEAVTWPGENIEPAIMSTLKTAPPKTADSDSTYSETISESTTAESTTTSSTITALSDLPSADEVAESHDPLPTPTAGPSTLSSQSRSSDRGKQVKKPRTVYPEVVITALPRRSAPLPPRNTSAGPTTADQWSPSHHHAKSAAGSSSRPSVAEETLPSMNPSFNDSDDGDNGKPMATGLGRFLHTFESQSPKLTKAGPGPAASGLTGLNPTQGSPRQMLSDVNGRQRVDLISSPSPITPHRPPLPKSIRQISPALEPSAEPAPTYRNRAGDASHKDHAGSKWHEPSPSNGDHHSSPPSRRAPEPRQKYTRPKTKAGQSVSKLSSSDDSDSDGKSSAPSVALPAKLRPASVKPRRSAAAAPRLSLQPVVDIPTTGPSNARARASSESSEAPYSAETHPAVSKSLAKRLASGLAKAPPDGTQTALRRSETKARCKKKAASQERASEAEWVAGEQEEEEEPPKKKAKNSMGKSSGGGSGKKSGEAGFKGHKPANDTPTRFTRSKEKDGPNSNARNQPGLREGSQTGTQGDSRDQAIDVRSDGE